MDLRHDTTQYLEATRHDGWTRALKGRFLMLLAEAGNVRLSARRCGRSAQSAYVQRRRDPLFAQGWAAALVLARDHAEQVLADRALDGVEEAIFFRGEQVGSRRRYDTRLLLAHLARLDLLAADEAAEHDAGRFDQIVAVVAGHEVPEALAGEVGPLPPDREACAQAAAAEAEHAMLAALDDGDDLDGEVADEGAREDAIAASGDAAYVAAEREWDAWLAGAHALVDALEHAPLDSVNSVNFAPNPGFGLTLPAPCANGGDRSGA